MKVAKTFRLEERLVQRSQERADLHHDGNLTATVEEALRGLLGRSEEGSESAAGTDGATAPVDTGSPSLDEARVPPEAVETVELPQWLQEATGIPLALTARFVETGRVQVDGEEWRDPIVPENRLGNVCLDGLPVSG